MNGAWIIFNERRIGMLQTKAFVDLRAGADDDDDGVIGHCFPVGGCHLGATILLYGVSPGENPIQSWTSDGWAATADGGNPAMWHARRGLPSSRGGNHSHDGG